MPKVFIQATAPDGIGYDVGPVYTPKRIGEVSSEILAAGWRLDGVRTHLNLGDFAAKVAGERAGRAFAEKVQEGEK
jgi:hypothetical protein